MNRIVLLIIIVCLIWSCKKSDSDAGDPYVFQATPYTLQTPALFPILNLSSDNKLTVEGIALGRKLYYDTLLSLDGRSCAGCHLQTQAFTLSSVNSQPHINLAWNDKFLWNGKVEGSMEDIMKFEVEDFFVTDVNKIKSNPDYPPMFAKAFGSSTISLKRIEFALAQFITTMVSSDSKFDKFLRHELVLSPSEMNGFNIFNSEKGDCFHCHSIPLFTTNDYRNIGLDSIYNNSNSGRYIITGNSFDLGKFKVPTLRNVELTAPYMHDGRFATLEEVIDHYDHGVKSSPTLDPIMTKPGKENGLQLTVSEKADLVSFLKCLTDTSFINRTSLSSP
ncbi:MAG TPA: cytochrome c peroxidase [Bacteroidia bacterium]|nr:cytochrome c peroxidase [Bacteroidia bacterium]HNT80514.1 cytochrome c peroxidase [Bacteroidia bacterium]